METSEQGLTRAFPALICQDRQLFHIIHQGKIKATVIIRKAKPVILCKPTAKNGNVLWCYGQTIT